MLFPKHILDSKLYRIEVVRVRRSSKEDRLKKKKRKSDSLCTETLWSHLISTDISEGIIAVIDRVGCIMLACPECA